VYSEGIAQSVSWICQHLEQDLYSENLAQQSGMSLAQFYKRFVQEVGLTPNDYHLQQRIIAAKQALRNTSQSITDIALQLGMSSSQYFATVFKKIVGITPTDYRKLRSH
jgi:AraC-like DNA-binding protein